MKSWIKNKVVRCAASAGYELIPKWKFDRQPLVRHLQRLFDLQRIDCVLDVGGNLGQYHDLLREDVGFNGWILSFEPVAKYIAILQDRARSDPRWRIFNYALGSADQTSIIHVTKSPGLNSFLAPRTDAVKGFWHDDSVTHDETVRIRRLDDVYADLRSEFKIEAAYLKLDTQGYDLEVIKGAQEVLPQMRALQTEASVLPLYEGMPSDESTRGHLAARGFHISGMYPVSSDDHLRLIEYDCILINSRFCSH